MFPSLIFEIIKSQGIKIKEDEPFIKKGQLWTVHPHLFAKSHYLDLPWNGKLPVNMDSNTEAGTEQGSVVNSNFLADELVYLDSVIQSLSMQLTSARLRKTKILSMVSSQKGGECVAVAEPAEPSHRYGEGIIDGSEAYEEENAEENGEEKKDKEEEDAAVNKGVEGKKNEEHNTAADAAV